MVELFVDVVADQGLPAGAPERRVVGEIVLGQRVGQDEDGGFIVELADLADGEARPRPVVADERVFLVDLGLELRDRPLVEAALQDPEAGRARSALTLARDPGELFGQVRSDAAPKSRALGPVADDDSASHPSPRSTRGRSYTGPPFAAGVGRIAAGG